MLEAPIIDIPDVVDPVGVGDAFMGGFLHAINLFPGDRQRQLHYSLAAAALKNTIRNFSETSKFQAFMCDDFEKCHAKLRLFHRKCVILHP